MASGKRASMREGPLAALFRRTEEQGLEEKPADEPAVGEPAPPRPEPEAEVEQPPATEDPDKGPAVPSPRERLRHAFSSSIPENILERPPEAEAPAPPPRPSRPPA